MEESRDLSNLFHLAGGRHHSEGSGNTQQKLGRSEVRFQLECGFFVVGEEQKKHTLPNTNMDTKKDSLEKATPF